MGVLLLPGQSANCKREKKRTKSLHNLDSIQEQRIHLDVEYCFKQEEVFSFQDIMLAV